MLKRSEKLLKDFLELIGSPRFTLDVSMFETTSHPIIISNKENEICNQCPSSANCTAKTDIYIPGLGRFIYDKEYEADMDRLVSFLCGISAMLREYRELSDASENHEFYRQLVKKVIDLNPHALSVYDADKNLLYQNIIARSEDWTGENRKNHVLFPIFQGAKPLGQIKLVKAQSFSNQTVPFANPSREMAFHHILGTDPAITNCIAIAKQVSATNSTILILGESGTGKEVFANAIHKGSQRADEAFVTVNCAAIPENLLESELFGYVSGAFTGANKGGKTGKIVAADNGTLFLDEIGDLPLSLQAKLLRVLQDKKVEPIGSLKPTSVDVRVICATNKNLEVLITEKLFREDLFYRINVIPIHIPPLRTRSKDILILLDYNIKKYCILSDKPFKCFDPLLARQLTQYEWKGNVRELENVVEYAVTICNDDCITIEHLPLYLKKELSNRLLSTSRHEPIQQTSIHPKASGPIHKDSELKKLFDQYGQSTEGKKKIAQALDISLATLYRRIKKMKEEQR